LRRHRSQIEDFGDQIPFFTKLMRSIASIEAWVSPRLHSGTVDRQHAALLSQVALVRLQLLDLRSVASMSSRRVPLTSNVSWSFATAASFLAAASSPAVSSYSFGKEDFPQNLFDHGEPDLRILEVSSALVTFGFTISISFAWAGNLHAELCAGLRELRFGLSRAARVSMSTSRAIGCPLVLIPLMYIDFADDCVASVQVLPSRTRRAAP